MRPAWKIATFTSHCKVWLQLHSAARSCCAIMCLDPEARSCGSILRFYPAALSCGSVLGLDGDDPVTRRPALLLLCIYCTYMYIQDKWRLCAHTGSCAMPGNVVVIPCITPFRNYCGGNDWPIVVKWEDSNPSNNSNKVPGDWLGIIFEMCILDVFIILREIC